MILGKKKHLFLPLFSNQLHFFHLSAASPEQMTVNEIDLESWTRIMKICTHHRFLNVNVLLLRFSPWPAHSSPHSGSSSWHHLRFNDSSTETLSSTLLLFGSALEEEKIGGSSVLNNINGKNFASVFKRRDEQTFVSGWDLTVLPPFNWALFKAALDFIRVLVRSLLNTVVIRNHACRQHLGNVCV